MVLPDGTSFVIDTDVDLDEPRSEYARISKVRDECFLWPVGDAEALVAAPSTKAHGWCRHEKLLISSTAEPQPAADELDWRFLFKWKVESAVDLVNSVSHGLEPLEDEDFLDLGLEAGVYSIYAARLSGEDVYQFRRSGPAGR